MNILIAINRQYIFPAKTLIRSIAENCGGNINIYIVHSALTEKDAEGFRGFAEKFSGCSVKISFILVTDDLMKVFSTACHDRFPPEVFFRISGIYCLPEEVDRILYLDGDIIVNKDLSGLYNIDLEGAAFAAVKDPVSLSDEVPLSEQRKEQLGLPLCAEYVNAGVLLIDVKKFIGTYTLDEMLDVIGKNYERLKYNDQDLLNLMFQGKMKVLYDYRYNYFMHGHYVKFDVPDNIEPVICHFFASRKPWHWQSKNKESEKLFWGYAKMDGNRGKYFLLKLKRLFFVPVRNLVALITNRRAVN